MSNRFARTAVIPVIAALLLVGCAPAQDETTPTEAGSATESPSASATPTETEASTDGWSAVEFGMPFGEAMAAVGAEPAAATCDWVALTPSGAVIVTLQREEDGDDSSPVILVQWYAGDGAGEVGQRTPEGIGIGSTVDDALAAYPDAEQLAPEGMGDRRYLRVDGDGEADMFFSYTEGEERIWAVTMTSLPLPPYEPCA